MNLKRGTKFIHKRWLDDKSQPLVCEVTRVAQGVVYWKVEGERKARQYFPIPDADQYVKEILPA